MRTKKRRKKSNYEGSEEGEKITELDIPFERIFEVPLRKEKE